MAQQRKGGSTRGAPGPGRRGACAGRDALGRGRGHAAERAARAGASPAPESTAFRRRTATKGPGKAPAAAPARAAREPAGASPRAGRGAVVGPEVSARLAAAKMMRADRAALRLLLRTTIAASIMRESGRDSGRHHHSKSGGVEGLPPRQIARPTRRPGPSRIDPDPRDILR